ncbi:MAG: hypothetical protein ACOC4E_00935 [Patescibacteria group bacterium]
MAYSLPATPVALGLAVALAASPLTPAAAQESTVPTAMPDPRPERALSKAELMALPPFERSHQLCRPELWLGCTRLKEDPLPLREVIQVIRPDRPVQKVYERMLEINWWSEEEVTLDTIVPTYHDLRF